jgi:hypothetical protein
MKRLKNQTPVIVVLMAQSKNFIKLILTLIPKHDFIHMTCSAITQMYTNYRCQGEIISKVKTQLNVIKSSRLSKFLDFS